MTKNYPNIINKGISLPISDWLLIFIFLCLYPLVIISGLSLFGYFVSDIELLSVIISLTIFYSLIIVYYQVSSHNELKSYSNFVKYVHFEPKYMDNLLFLVMQIFTFSFQATILFLIFNFLLTYNFPLWFLLLLAGILSVIIQFILLVISQLGKKKLFKTAQEPIPQKVHDHLSKNHPESHKISQYRFTDIKPASLFLSAGVTSLGFKLTRSGLSIDSICVISRYFQWKLSDDELIAVLSHEQGHVIGNDMRNSYLTMGTDGWLRAVKFFSIILLFTYIPILVNDYGISIALVVIIALIGPILIANTAMKAHQQNRIFLLEIRADKFGSELVGNNKLADVLKKLPSVIPAPVDDNALGFLGFRVEILRKRSKDLKEPIEQLNVFNPRRIYKVN